MSDVSDVSDGERLLEVIKDLGLTLVRREDLVQLWMGYGDDCPDSPAGFYERMEREYGL